MKRTSLTTPAPAGVGSPAPAASVRTAPVGARVSWEEVRARLDRVLDAALDEGSGLDTDSMDTAALVTALREAERIVARATALRLRIVTAAARTKAAHTSSDASLAGFVARASGQDYRSGKEAADLAERFCAGRCTATRAELDAGRISPDKATIITRALDDLPQRVSDAQRDVIERDLLAAARHLSPARLRVAGRHALASVEPDDRAVDAHENALIADEETRAWQACSFTIRDNHDGTMSGRFTVPALEGAALRALVDTLSAPRRLNDPTSPRPEGRRIEGSSMPGPSLDLTPDQRRQRELERIRAQGQVFADLLAHLPSDRLSAASTATVVVTTTLEALRDGLAAASSTDTGHRVSAGATRRLACTAGIVPAVLGVDSVPLDLGRRTRLFTPAQRTALSTLYDACAAVDCDRPYAWCELHHLRPWSAGGETALDNAIPLCPHHHRLLHRDDVEHEVHKPPAEPVLTPARGRLAIRFRV